MFPGEQDATWSYDEQAGAWYFHRFYDFQPDLNWDNPDVRAEIGKVMAFWLQLGVSGFRIDAAPFVIEETRPGVDPGPKDFAILDGWRQDTQWQRGDSVLLCEANVAAGDVSAYVGSRPDGPADRAQMMFDFLINPKAWLALARQDAEPLIDGLTTAVKLPTGGQWATFLRNHDELDLSRLTDEQRADVFSEFAPRSEMRLYGRGIRRRLAPMLRGDRRRIELGYALQFSLPGTPVLRYGEEIGMGENLGLADRDAIRTPMQWDDGRNAGFSTATLGRADPARDDAGSVRRQAGECASAEPRSQLVAALVRESRAHAAHRAGDRSRRLLGRRRRSATAGAGAPLRRADRLGAAAPQPCRRRRHRRHRSAGRRRRAVRSARRRSLRRPSIFAAKSPAARLGLSVDPAVPQ